MEFFTLREVAKILGISKVQTWRIIVQDKKIPARKIGNVWFVRPHHVREFVAAREAAEKAS